MGLLMLLVSTILASDMSIVNMLYTSITHDLSIRQLMRRPDSAGQFLTPSQLLAHPQSSAQI
jgi:hypothetical protein